MGLLEIVIIAVAALVLLGPKELPSVLKQLGRFYVQLRRTSNEVRGVFDDIVREAEKELRIEELKKIRALAEEELAKVQEGTISNNSNATLDVSNHGKLVGAENTAVAAEKPTSVLVASQELGAPRQTDNHSPWQNIGFEKAVSPETPANKAVDAEQERPPASHPEKAP